MNNQVVLIIHDSVGETDGPQQQDVLTQRDTVSQSLSELHYTVRTHPLTFNLHHLVSTVEQVRPCMVFNLVESIGGHDRLQYMAPAVLETLNVPFTGCGSDPLYMTTGKIQAKKMMAASNIQTPSWYTLPVSINENITPGTYIRKSRWNHASLGIDDNSILEIGNTHHLDEACSDPLDEMFLEAYIDGREFNISLLETPGGVTVLPHAEILFNGFPLHKPRIVNFRAKWDTESFEYKNTTRKFHEDWQQNHLLQNISQIALRCWHVFGLSGYARVDFRVDSHNIPWVLEINANPCLSPDAGFMAAAATAGLTYTETIDCIVQCALRDKRNTHVQNTPCIR